MQWDCRAKPQQSTFHLYLLLSCRFFVFVPKCFSSLVELSHFSSVPPSLLPRSQPALCYSLKQRERAWPVCLRWSGCSLSASYAQRHRMFRQGLEEILRPTVGIIEFNCILLFRCYYFIFSRLPQHRPIAFVKEDPLPQHDCLTANGSGGPFCIQKSLVP